MEDVLRFDRWAFRWINVGFHTPWLDPFFLVISTSGLAYVQLAVVLLLWFSPNMRQYITPLVLAILVGGIPIADLFKHIFDRDRPSNLSYALPQEHIFAYSFPSGHSTTSFAMATMILLLSWSTPYRWVGPVAMFWACLVGFSRIYRGVHWPTDVAGGACAGIFAACAVYLLTKPRTAPSTETSRAVEP